MVFGSVSIQCNRTTSAFYLLANKTGLLFVVLGGLGAMTMNLVAALRNVAMAEASRPRDLNSTIQHGTLVVHNAR